MKSKLLKGLEYFFIPNILLITTLSAFILLAATPTVWETVYDATMEQKLKPHHLEDAHSISRAFWTEQSYTEVNQSLNRKFLGKKEISHYEDVRSLIHFFFIPLTLGIILLSLWKFLLKRNIRWGTSLLYFLAIGITLLAWALIDWRHLFRTLHWWIFQDDSWILPKRCYTLYLFPYAVWQTISNVVLSSTFIFLFAGTLINMFLRLKKYRSAEGQPES